MQARYRRFLAKLRKPFRYPERRRRRKLRDAMTEVQAREQRCLDCGTLMEGPYCHACGQKEGTLKRPLWTFITDAFDYTLSSDSRFYRTIVSLVLRPGFLTREYMNGHRTRYFPPVRLYIVVSIGFFLLLTLANVSILDLKLVPKDDEQTEETSETGGDAPAEAAPDTEPEAPQSDGVAPATEPAPAETTPANSPEVEAVVQDVISSLNESGVELKPEAKADLERQLRAKESAENADDDDVIIGAAGGTGFDLPEVPYRLTLGMFVPVSDAPRISLTPEETQKLIDSKQFDVLTVGAMHGLARSFEDPTTFNSLFNIWMPRALLVLMPIFALLLWITHWGKGRNYVHQLVFSLHFHSFLFLLMAALTVVVPIYGGDIGFSVFWWGTSLYIIVALKVGQMQGWIRAFLKAGFIWVTYFVILLGGILTAVFQGLRAL
ncbi:DUF3667 domain-containing protein [Gimibacter soli]|uniref:DUF3667 domain-containing protein n=1 Tax=Gimibacter soli TaxID=3024400 RepID=A0AAE9XP31_9PROT|nr:DUF3667 domain-containing protein [Gimibacter soli]WCL53726.1 DUF3667 domain-containing protein [Gimibacter soli]